MSEKIPCPVTLGEYKRIMDNREKEHKCNCNGKCKLCKCKEREENNLYNLFTETQKQIVHKVCEYYNLNLEDCELKTRLGTEESYYDCDKVMLCTPERVVILPIQVKYIGIENKMIDKVNIYDRLDETQKQIVQAVCDDMGIKLDDCVIIIKHPDNERYLPQVMLAYLDRIIALPIMTEDVK